MKKLAILGIVAMALVLALASVVYAAPPTPTLLDRVDIGVPPDSTDPSSEFGHSLAGWGPIEPATHGGGWGGIAGESPPGNCRVVWSYYDSADDPWAELTLDTGGAGMARHIQMRVLDGIADDSFNVYVKNPGGNWALVYSYTCDPATNEYWVVHDIYSFPAGKGQGTTIEIRIESTAPAWTYFNPYGQLAVDWVEVFDH